MSNRWKIILIATLFNILFEYSLRGVNNLRTQPFLPVILFSIYFTLFTMLEDLIVRFKLRDYHLMILAFFYGTIYCAYTSGIAFINPTFGGVAIMNLIYINVIWWGALQAVLTFYLANLLSPRDWDHPRLSRKGWFFCLAINLFTVALFQKSGAIPTGTPAGRFTIFLILILSLTLSIISIKIHKKGIKKFQRNGFLTFLSVATVFLFLFCALFLIHDPILSNTSHVNASSLKIVGSYTVLLLFALCGYRILGKKEISI